MTDIRRVSLFSKLNPMLYKALETATAFAKLRGNAYVELVHWLHQILQQQDSDMLRIIRRAGLNLDAVEQVLTHDKNSRLKVDRGHGAAGRHLVRHRRRLTGAAVTKP